MALTAEQLQELVVQEFGNSDLVAANLELYWELHEGKPDMLRFHYTRLSLCDLLLTQRSVLEAVSYSEDGQAQDLSDLFKHYEAKRSQILADIKAYNLQAAASSSGGVAVGRLTTRVPIEYPTGYPRTDVPWSERGRP